MNEYKIVLIGDGGVGKSSLINCLMSHNFQPIYTATVGVDVHPYIHNKNNYIVWDTAGQAKFSGLNDGYYLNADLAILLYDERKMTIKSIESRTKLFKKMCPNSPVVVVRNKNDISSKYDIPVGFRTSTKNNTGIEELFAHIDDIIQHVN